MAQQSKYTEKQIKQALEIYSNEGLQEAYKRTGIPKGTIVYYRKKHGVRITQSRAQEKTKAAREERARRLEEYREELRERLIRTATKVASRIEDIVNEEQILVGKSDSTASRELAITLGILVDKYRLEAGEATERHEIVGSEARKKIASRLDELDERRKQKQSIIEQIEGKEAK